MQACCKRGRQLCAILSNAQRSDHVTITVKQQSLERWQIIHSKHKAAVRLQAGAKPARLQGCTLQHIRLSAAAVMLLHMRCCCQATDKLIQCIQDSVWDLVWCRCIKHTANSVVTGNGAVFFQFQCSCKFCPAFQGHTDAPSACSPASLPC